MHEKSLTELRAALAAKECSAVELAQLYLKRIGQRIAEGHQGRMTLRLPPCAPETN